MPLNTFVFERLNQASPRAPVRAPSNQCLATKPRHASLCARLTDSLAERSSAQICGHTPLRLLQRSAVFCVMRDGDALELFHGRRHARTRVAVLFCCRRRSASRWCGSLSWRLWLLLRMARPRRGKSATIANRPPRTRPGRAPVVRNRFIHCSTWKKSISARIKQPGPSGH